MPEARSSMSPFGDEEELATTEGGDNIYP